MLKRACKSLLVSIPILFGIATIVLAQDSDSDECKALFVHNAGSVSMNGDTITMEDVSPIVTFFCDRPVRYAGVLSIQGFLDIVSEGDDSFAANPPNALLTIVSDSEQPVDVVVELPQRPTSGADSMTYPGVKVIKGEIPQSTGPGSLFIDHFGHPMSPGSVAGVHRRHERRHVRNCAADNLDNPNDLCNCGPGLACN
ncbi:hypothetical protein [Ruegeria sp. Ofav3-42]|uniref:hypothetical protein n=1 Tax=Ruegeria sp. Ofav3-42 TaxID=2917759 RepID=UPI001EF731E9|nr:hypothetical protein [Ruegeria sp. Ofav3-42]MCG7521784.1 hypothetical protein [Ruegeria sp. Ofav3-42]